MKKHKWYNEIKAWADGAEIQMWYPQYDEWGDCINPMFNAEQRYRIKPQPKEPQYLYVFDNGFDKHFTTIRYGGVIRTDKPHSTYKYIGKIKLEVNHD